ncbi:hypothetical protein CKF46_37440, partial [Klebsiella pneumoniae]
TGLQMRAVCRPDKRRAIGDVVSGVTMKQDVILVLTAAPPAYRCARSVGRISAAPSAMLFRELL